MRRHRPGPRRQSPVSYESVAEDARIEWFWYTQIVGQGGVNLSNLRGLTAGEVEGVIGTRLTWRGSRT